jgi:hypothetical protein
MTLTEYLKKPTDYDLGVKFYNAHFGPGKWERKYSNRATPRFLLANLIYDLKKLAASGKNIEVDVMVQVPEDIVAKLAKASIKSAQQMQDFGSKLSSASNDKSVPSPQITYSNDRAGKELEARNLYGRAGKRREDLFSADKKVREAAALSIKADMKRNRELWMEINHFDKNGEWPTKDTAVVEVDIEALSIQELISMKQNLAPWCSKEKKKIANELDADKKAKRTLVLEEKQELLKKVNSRLDGI